MSVPHCSICQGPHVSSAFTTACSPSLLPRIQAARSVCESTKLNEAQSAEKIRMSSFELT